MCTLSTSCLSLYLEWMLVCRVGNYGNIEVCFWSIWVTLCNQLCVFPLPASGPASHLAWQKLRLDLVCKLFYQICSYLSRLLAPLTSTIVYHFQWLWLWLKVTKLVHCKVKPVGFICSQFLAHQDEMQDGVEAIEFENLILLLNEICWIKGNNCCFTDSFQKL